MSTTSNPSAVVTTTRAGYDQWASCYDTDGNPILALEQPHVDRLLGDVNGLSVLDVGYGTGRQPEGPGSDAARKMFAGLVKDIAPAVAMEWANTIKQAKPRREAFFEVFMDWKSRDPFAANEFLAKCGWSAERLQELRREVGR